MLSWPSLVAAARDGHDNAALVFSPPQNDLDVRWFMQALGRGREDFDPVFRHANGVLKLRGQFLIARHGGPAIAEDFYIRLTQVNHRLNGKEHAFA